MKKEEASYTAELALLLPVLLFSLLAPVYMGYEMYEQTKATSICGWKEDTRAEAAVLKIKFAKEVWEEWK